MIAAVASQEDGATAALATSVSHAFANPVTTNNLVTVTCVRFSTSSDTFVAGSCAQSAGTAKLLPFALDRATEFQLGVAQYVAVAFWSALVLSTGTCTVAVSGVPALSTLMLGHGEYTGSWDGTRSEVTSTQTGTSTAASTGAAQSSKAGLWIGGLALGIPGIITITQKALYTLLFKDETNGTGSVVRAIASNGARDSAAWTLSLTQQYLAMLNVYREAGGMPPTFPIGAV